MVAPAVCATNFTQKVFKNIVTNDVLCGNAETASQRKAGAQNKTFAEGKRQRNDRVWFMRKWVQMLLCAAHITVDCSTEQCVVGLGI